MATKQTIKRTGWREAFGILLLAAGVLSVLGQMSYFWGDVPVLQSPPQRPAANFVGPMGAWFGFISFMTLGVVGYLVPVILIACGFMLVIGREIRVLSKLGWMCLLVLCLVCVAQMQSELWSGVTGHLNIEAPGGLLGRLAGDGVLIRLLGGIGTAVIAAAGLIIGLNFLFDLRPFQMLRQSTALCSGLIRKASAAAGAAMDTYRDRDAKLRREEKEVARQRRRLERSVRQQQAGSKDDPATVFARTVEDTPDAAIEAPVGPGKAFEPVPEPLRGTPLPSAPPPRRPARPTEPENESELLGSYDDPDRPPEDRVEYLLPPIDLLHESDGKEVEVPDFTASAGVLEATLRDFGIECKVTNVERGPVVTRFEVLPAAGVRVERISGLSNNIALALKAVSVRVQAPIPGKGVVGIEVPNRHSTMVFLRELLEHPHWIEGDFALPLALGKDVAGHDLIADLADMPHLLIAGATGSGKTVCMNSLLAGILMSRTPEQVRMMLIDPKIVEFGPYNDLPHLVVPVINDPKKVGMGLRWAIQEMEKRYKMFAKVGVRNVRDFNQRERVKQGDLFGEGAAVPDAEHDVPDTLPYILVVIDELADLMLAAQAEIENSIARLAQLSRAVGIHMIIATQRPSVNVITGTIKANFPGRIAFQVAQKVDSRTILDSSGAEKLLGKGDLLFLPPGSSKLVRAQGAFTADDEIQRMVSFIKDQGSPEYVHEVKDRIEGNQVDLPDIDLDDELLESAVEIIRQTRRASTSSLQRRLRIGYTRAARLMDILEEKGVIGPPQGSDPREILIDLDGDIPQNQPLMESEE